MKGLFFDFVNKQGLAERLGQVVSKEMTDGEVEERLKTLSLSDLFVKSELQGLASEYKAIDSPQLVKSQEKPSRYVLKQKLTNPKGEAFYFTLALSRTSKCFEVSSANILALDTDVMNQLSKKEMTAWKKTIIHEEEQLKEWAVAEYLNYHICTQDPEKADLYSRMLSEYGADTEYRKQLHDKYALFFPINRMMHAQKRSFDFISLDIIESRLQARKYQFMDRPLSGLVEEMTFFINWQNSLIYDRVIETPLLKDDYARYIHFLKLNKKDELFKKDVLSTYGHSVSDRLGNSYLTLLNIAQGVYQSALMSQGGGDILIEGGDHINDFYSITYNGFIGYLSSLGKDLTNEQLKSAYHLYDDIIHAKFKCFLDQLPNVSRVADRDLSTVARFLLVNEELCRNVREARPDWYYSFMMHFKQEDLQVVLAGESHHNKEARAIASLLDRQPTGDLMNDCRAALALFTHDANNGICNTALPKKMVKKYGNQLENHKLFYKLILRYPTELIQQVFDASEETVLGEKIMASKSGHVTMDFKHDLAAVQMLIKTGQDAIAKPILTDMYSRQYYCALSFTEKQQLNDLCDRETSLGSSRDALRQKASQYKVTSMGYWDRVTFLRENGRSWWRSLWDACVNKNTIIISDWSSLAFGLDKGMKTLKQLQQEYHSKTELTALSVQVPPSNSRAIFERLGVDAREVINDSQTQATPVSSHVDFSPSTSPRELKPTQQEEVSASLRV